jgi:hypothetical protein
MDNKLSELSKPVAWTDSDAVDILKAGEWAPVFPEKYQDSFPLYSQEYVSALLADNEAKDKRIAELEGKLATPVRLLGEMLVHDWEHSVERQAAFQHRKIAWDARLAEDKKAILAAGFTFTVEGDE